MWKVVRGLEEDRMPQMPPGVNTKRKLERDLLFHRRLPTIFNKQTLLENLKIIYPSTTKALGRPPQTISFQFDTSIDNRSHIYIFYVPLVYIVYVY